MSPDQNVVDAICREIDRVQGLHDAALYEEGDTAFHTAISWGGEAIGLRKALCALHGWPMEEAAKEGKADQLYEKWLATVDDAGPVRPDDDGPDCRRCGKPSGKWWLIDAGTDAEHRMLCPDCDAAATQQMLRLPERPDEEPTT